jgi:hypothetical protein
LFEKEKTYHSLCAARGATACCKPQEHFGCDKRDPTPSPPAQTTSSFAKTDIDLALEEALEEVRTKPSVATAPLSSPLSPIPGLDLLSPAGSNQDDASSDASFHTAVQQHEDAVTATFRQMEIHAQIAEVAESPTVQHFRQQLDDFAALSKQYQRVMAHEKALVRPLISLLTKKLMNSLKAP